MLNLEDLNLPTDAAVTPDRTKQKLPILIPSSDHPDDYILQTDNSTDTRTRECWRSWEYYSIYRRESSSQAALDFGTAHHLGLEHKAFMLGNEPINAPVMEEIIEIVHEFYRTKGTTDYWRTPDRVIDQLTAYFRKWKREPFEVLTDKFGTPMVELGFSRPFCTLELNAEIPYDRHLLVRGAEGEHQSFRIRRLHVFFTGKIDLVVRDEHGIWTLDHKTHSVGGDTFFDSFVLSSQGRAYKWALEDILGEPVQGFLLDAIYGRPPTKTNERNWNFTRQKYYHSDESVAEWKADFQYRLTQLCNSLISGHFPANDSHCISRYGKCRYHDVCRQPSHLRLDLLETDKYTNVDWDPLASH